MPITYNPAKVVINNNMIYQKLNLYIAHGTGYAVEADGTVVATLPNAQVEIEGQDTATWTNGTDTWYIQTDGCGCHGGA